MPRPRTKTAPQGAEQNANVVDVVQRLADAAGMIAYAVAPACDIDRSEDDRNPHDRRIPLYEGATLTLSLNRIADAIHKQVETQDGLHRIADAINNLADAVRGSKRAVNEK